MAKRNSENFPTLLEEEEEAAAAKAEEGNRLLLIFVYGQFVCSPALSVCVCVRAMKHMLHLPSSVVDELHYMAAVTVVSACIRTYSHTHSKRDRGEKNERG